VAGEEETSIYTALARLKTGHDTAAAFAMVDSLTHDHVMGGMFFAYGMMGVYLHFREQLPDSLGDRIRNAFRVRAMYRGDTENHWVTYYTGMYLAAQTWPGEDGSLWFNGKSSTENFREAEEWLSEWMRITSTIGQGEFDSPTYFIVFVSPMLVLHEFALDPVMRTKAGMMLDLLLADYAAEHLRGNYGGGHSRDYPDDIVNPLAAPAAMWAWLYFGEPQIELWKEARYRPRHRGSWETIWGAISTYRVPDVIREMATDRSREYVHTETKRVRNIIRFGTVKNPPVYKYTFMAPEFVLGSLQGGILQPIQQHTWDVTYTSDKTNNTLFTLHPFVSGRELAMFFPEEQKFLAEEVNRYHLVYTNPEKWNSSSPYEQVFQHRDALIALYDIPEGEVHPHIDGFFPKSLDERKVDPSGWIVCRAGDVYIAVFPVGAYEWIEEHVDWRLRSKQRRMGVVVQVAAKRTAGSFESFTAAIRHRLPREDSRDGRMRVRYVTAAGDSMSFTYGGDRTVNGRTVDFSSYRLFNGPFMSADVGTGIITLRHGRMRRVLDFPRARVTEESSDLHH
jgi:hypothetical protein